MAMPSGNGMSDKMQFPVVGSGGLAAGVGGNGVEFHTNHQQPRPWFPDERDGFIMWLRGEFAAANSIIDLLCQHLCAVGGPGEYDTVIGSIQQRRCNWNPILHMQQFYSVAEVDQSLQQVAWRRQHQQQHRYYDPVPKGSGKEFKRSGGVGFRQGQKMNGSDSHNHDSNVSEKVDKVKENLNEGKKLEDKDLSLTEDKKDLVPKPHSTSSLKNAGSSEKILSTNSGSEIEEIKDELTPNSKGDTDSHSLAIPSPSVNQNLSTAAKTFDATETFDGKTVNVVNGLKLYEELFDSSDVSKLVSLVNDLRAAGRKKQMQGNTYTLLKRPMKGHGSEIIQFGIPIAEIPTEDENVAGSSIERKLESIPALLQTVVDRLVSMQVTTVKPDSCIIDIFNEGEYSQPHMRPQTFGRPVCIVFLTECDMVFGKVIGVDHLVSGDYKGSLKLSLSPGSLLSMQGKSADFAKHAIPSIRKQRILITFTKSQEKKPIPSDNHRLPSATFPPVPNWGPQLNRPPNYIRPSTGPKYYPPPVLPTGELPVPPLRPPRPAQNGVQPLFIAATSAPFNAFPAPVPVPSGATWPMAPPRFPVPGTGVFLPPPAQQVSDEMGGSPERENGSVLKGKSNEKGQKQDCNGGTGMKEGDQQNVDMKVESKPAGAV